MTVILNGRDPIQPFRQQPGRKFDESKLRYDLIPSEFLEGLAKVLTMGAKKYGDRNWEKGIDYSRLYAATLRHLIAWVKGENIDEESGLNHLLHAICNLVFIFTLSSRGKDYVFDNLRSPLYDDFGKEIV